MRCVLLYSKSALYASEGGIPRRALLKAPWFQRSLGYVRRTMTQLFTPVGKFALAGVSAATRPCLAWASNRSVLALETIACTGDYSDRTRTLISATI